MVVPFSFSNRTYSIWNTTALGLLALFFWVKGGDAEDTNFVFWPGAFFLSLWILTQWLSVLHQSYHSERHLINRTLVGLALAFGVLHLFLTGTLLILLERLFGLEEHFTFHSYHLFLGRFWYYGPEGAAIALIYFVFLQTKTLQYKLDQEHHRYASLLADIRETDLRMLKSELNPHFIYNAMNGIAMRVRMKENRSAIQMIASLTDLLRTVLSSRKVHLVPLTQEIDYLQKYLSIEEARFGKSVSMAIDFPDEVLPALVPPLILQPLVENAFKHGVPAKGEGTRIHVVAKKNKEDLVIEVYNSVAAEHKIITEEGAGGIGLSNVIHRLRQLYGVAFRFQVLNQADGVLCRMTVPFHE